MGLTLQKMNNSSFKNLLTIILVMVVVLVGLAFMFGAFAGTVMFGVLFLVSVLAIAGLKDLELL